VVILVAHLYIISICKGGLYR